MRSPTLRPVLAFAAIFVFIFLLHAPLLQLPYFWDEAGYYVPAARDILLTGSLIPHSTLSSAHPPLVLAWLALWWKVILYKPLVTRAAMLLLTAFSLLGLFRLAEHVTNTQVAIAATVCTALYPVFFAQSSLAQVDLVAAGLIFWGLRAYFEDRRLGLLWRRKLRSSRHWRLWLSRFLVFCSGAGSEYAACGRMRPSITNLRSAAQTGLQHC